MNRVGGTSPAERNIISGNSSDGINIGGIDQIVVGNYVGIDVTGTSAIGNNNGISIGGGRHSFVGGPSSVEQNVISGNSGWGIRAWLASENWIIGNFLGVDRTGSVAFQNGEAVHVDSRSTKIVFQGNTISGNWGGIVLGDGSERNVVRANRIGVAAFNDAPVSNGLQGVRVESAFNQIGGPYPDDGNTIAHNHGGGVEVWTHSGNSILGNSIHSNDGWGIQLENGGNDSLAPPKIFQAGARLIRGKTCPDCRVDVFSDEGSQGRIFEGKTVANGAGFFRFVPATRLQGPYVTCTATDDDGNTSEFSDPAALTLARQGGRRVAP
jgi:parallel beta-helix repeat protein